MIRRLLLLFLLGLAPAHQNGWAQPVHNVPAQYTQCKEVPVPGNRPPARQSARLLQDGRCGLVLDERLGRRELHRGHRGRRRDHQRRLRGQSGTLLLPESDHGVRHGGGGSLRREPDPATGWDRHELGLCGGDGRAHGTNGGGWGRGCERLAGRDGPHRPHRPEWDERDQRDQRHERGDGSHWPHRGDRERQHDVVRPSPGRVARGRPSRMPIPRRLPRGQGSRRPAHRRIP